MNFFLSMLLLLIASPAFAEAPAAAVDKGDTAWMLASAAMVMLMTPALAMFYGGMVRRKNVLATIMQSFAAIAVVSLQWILFGYSLAFGPDFHGIIGGLDWAGLNSVSLEPNADYAPTIPHMSFMIYQAMFAAITPALITGAFAERIKFSSFMIFTFIWVLVVYEPVAHWVWGKGGWMNQLGVMDFAGGIVVHVTSGILMSRVINDVKMLSALFDEVLRACIIEIPKIFILMGIAFYRKWDMTAACLLIVPVFAVSARKLGKKVKQRSHEAQKNVSYLTHRLGESITGIKVIKVFNREGLRDEKFTAENRNVYRENVRAIRLKEINKLVIDCLTGLAIGFVLIYGGRQVVTGVVTPGDFASILTAIYLVFSPIKQVGESYTTLQGILASLERVDHVMETRPEETGTLKIEGFKEGINYEGVCFEFTKGGQTVLQDINLRVRAGEILALVGPSGAGKTTVVHLLPRFYTPTKGRLTIDGVDIGQMDIHALRSLIGIVSQDIVLFNDTVRENIAFGSPDASFDAIKTAAEMAFAAEFIEKMPEGYDTILGERGMTLSGGQRQRIAIARAILKNPPIMILDEATSSLDSVSEALVQQALEGLMKGRTTIVIAHRLSTIKNADRIVVLKDGKIIDVGTHDELLSASDTYRSLYHTFAMTEDANADNTT